MREHILDIVETILKVAILIGLIAMIYFLNKGDHKLETRSSTIEVIHNDTKNVTCFSSSTGLQCFPDYLLEPPIREIRKASSTDDTAVYKFLLNNRKP